MNKQLNISVFGLKLTTIDELKLIIERLLPKSYSVNWTNINDASLDVLLISHLFYDLPNIVTIRQRPSLKTLKIAHDPVVQSQIIQDTFYLPIDADAIKLWFENKVFEQSSAQHQTLPALVELNAQREQQTSSNIEKEQQPQRQDSLKQIQTTPSPDISTATVQNQDIRPSRLKSAVAENIITQTTLSQNSTPSIIEKVTLQNVAKAVHSLRPTQTNVKKAFVRAKRPLAEQVFYQAIHYKHFENLQQKLWQTNEYRQCILIAGDNKIALIDKPNHQFWLANGLTTVGQSSMQLQHADLNNVVRFCHRNQPYDLHYGLWNFVWQNVGHIVPSYTGYYRLKHWPQPLQHKDQKDIFKIAAYLQQGANLQYIHEHSGIALELIYRFVFASLVSNSIEVISEQQADPRFKRVPTTEPIVESQSTLRNFFGKLRKKLGL